MYTRRAIISLPPTTNAPPFLSLVHARSVTPRARHKRTLLAWLPARMRDELLGYERSQSEAFVPVDELFKLAASPTNKTSQEKPRNHWIMRNSISSMIISFLLFFFPFVFFYIVVEIEAFLFVLFIHISFNLISRIRILSHSL